MLTLVKRDVDTEMLETTNVHRQLTKNFGQLLLQVDDLFAFCGHQKVVYV